MLEDIELVAQVYLKQKTAFDDGVVGNPFSVCAYYNCFGYDTYLAGLAGGYHYFELVRLAKIENHGTKHAILFIGNPSNLDQKRKKWFKYIINYNPFLWNYPQLAKLTMHLIENRASNKDREGLAFAKNIMQKLVNHITVELYYSDDEL